MPKFKRLTHFFIIAALLSGIGAVIFQLLAVKLFGWQSTVHREEINLPFKAYLNINVTNIPLKVDIYDGEEIKISYINETAVFVEENEYSYTINQDADFALSLFSLDVLNYHIEILLPDKIYREVQITSASGNVEFLNTYTKSLDITSRSGDITVNYAVGNIRLKNASGNIAVQFTDYNEISSLENRSGNITVEMPSGRAVWLEFLTETGVFTSDFFRKEYKDIKGDIFLASKENAKKLSVNTTSGNLSFMKIAETPPV